MIKSKKEICDQKWMKNYKLAKEFYVKNKHLLIPYNYKIENINLGKWITLQREYYNKKGNKFFSQNRINKLNDIGMVWDINSNFWNKMYNELISYKEEFGNIRVPQSYITESGNKLGVWLNRQRECYKAGKISNVKKNKLINLGIIWEPRKDIKNRWEINYNEIRDYKRIHKCLPKSDYINQSGVKLGYWLSSQRACYKAGKLLPDREEKLKRIGALRNNREDIWKNTYNNVAAFYEKHGNIKLQDEKLLKWITRQKILYKKNKLDLIKIKKLEKINIIWENNKEIHWKKMYERAKLFYINHGHLHISKNPNTSCDYKLGIWLDYQRVSYRNNKDFNKNKIKLLEEIGMKWNLYKSPKEIWNEWYLKAKDFYDNNNHLNPPKGKLRTWVFAQRAAKKKLRGNISEEQIRLLEKIGMVWDIKKDNWDKMYNYAKKYYQIHEMLNIPVNYITEDGHKLGIWISRQRNVYKNLIRKNSKPNESEQKRIKLLNKIDMIWDASKLTTKTSFQEKAIFYYLSKTFNDIKKISQWEFIGYELDIYIPSINTAIEYDGIWHEKTLKNDNKKNRACKKNGITLIRIREPNLPDVSDCPVIIELENTGDVSFEKALTKLFSLLNIKNTICNIKRDRNKILYTYKDYSSHSWDNNYEKVYLYYKKKNIHSKLDKHLKYWLITQRGNYKNGLLTPLQVKKLKKINFDFGPYESRWEKTYELAVNYYNKHGNLNVPYKYKTNNISLGYWIYKQKKLYKNKTLDLNHIKLLEKLNINWSIKQSYNKKININKNVYFQELKLYYKKHGNIDVSLGFISKNGLKIGKWLARRRKDYKKNKLDKMTILELNKLNIKWDIFKDKWNSMYEIAKKYYNEHGNILISAKYVTEDKIHLGDWISRQRQKYNNNLLTKIQIKKLNSIGMVWNPNEEKWIKNYELAKKFYVENKHLNIPVDYVTQDGIKLGMWLNTQKQANRGNPNFLMTPQRKKLLDDICMNWEIKHPHLNAKKRACKDPN